MVVGAVATAAGKGKDPSYDGYNFPNIKTFTGYPDIPTEFAAGEDLAADLFIYDLQGKKIPMANLWRDKPAVIEFGSATCPIHAARGDDMERVVQDYGSQINIVILYVREAHPGILRAHHTSFEQKLERARLLQTKVSPRSVYVDTLDGALHNRLVPSPNGVYLIGTDGKVAFRSVWNEPTRLRVEIERLLSGEGQAKNLTHWNEDLCPQPRIESPLVMAGYMVGMAVTGGPDAAPDFLINGIFRNRNNLDNPLCSRKQ